MSTYTTQITITNNSSDTLTMDVGATTGIEFGAWPYELPPNSTLGPFSQGWSFQVKFHAIYVNQLSSNVQKPTLDLYMYADGLGVHSLQINQTPNNPPPYPNSTTTRVNGSYEVLFTIG